ncbi:MAG: DUF1501 domain-containing protein [Pseudomonadota bacterium]
MVDRRRFLSASAASALATLASTRLTFASIPTEKRLIFIVLRGGLDSLHALPPYADKDFLRLRPTLARAGEQADGVVDLDGYFGMHRALAPLLSLYEAKALLFVPAAATQYRDRSHFDGQNLLENGSGKPYGAKTGWLNRALEPFQGEDRRFGLSIGPAVPLILQGDVRIQTWSDSALPDADEDFLRRLLKTYSTDPLFSDALQDAVGAPQTEVGSAGMRARPLRGANFTQSVRAAADLLSRVDGPRVAVLDLDGWDTHFDQDRRLSTLFESLSQGILALQSGLAQHWSDTAVLVVSEFGRTAAENGNRGTDHGTGGLAMLAGGAVAGGRINGVWPGLSSKALWEGRDLRAVNSYESLFKALLMGHLGLEQNWVEDQVFPQSRRLEPMSGLLRT